MSHILLLTSSPRGAASLSTKVAVAIAERLEKTLDVAIKHRDLATETMPHIGADYVVGRMLPAEQRTPGQAESVAFTEILVGELTRAEVVVIAASMINFAPPSSLKAWIDHVVWPGRTMKPTPQGPAGLLKDRKVYLVVASGGVYSAGPMSNVDSLVPYLKYVLGCIGLLGIEVIRIEAQSFGPEAAGKSFEDAMSRVAELALPTPDVQTN